MNGIQRLKAAAGWGSPACASPQPNRSINSMTNESAQPMKPVNADQAKMYNAKWNVRRSDR